MSIYTLFKRDGRVSQTIAGSFQLVVAPTIAGWVGFHYEGDYDDSYYFFDGEPVKRPVNPSTLNKSRISNVPPNSIVRIDGDVYEAGDGGDIELVFNQRGIYKVVVESFPYLDKEFTIDYQP